MKIARRFTKQGQDVFKSVQFDKRTSRISNPDGSVVFEMNDAEVPSTWSQLATDIMVSKYFRKAGVPQVDENGQPLRDARGEIVTGPEKSARQVINRLAGCWRHWGEKHGYFDTAEDAQAFHDELCYMLLTQMCAPNSPQWFNTGLNHAYGITGPAQGHYFCDPRSGELLKSRDAYSHPQPHACQPFFAPISTPKGAIRIGKIVEQNMIGLEVFDGTEEGRGTTRVLAVKCNGEKLVVRVQLTSGTAVYATRDHLVYCVPQGSTIAIWCEVGELRCGDRLVERVAIKEPMSRPYFAPVTAAAGERVNGKPAMAADRAEALVLNRRVEVTDVSELGFETVYDIQTESGQYLSNNVIVHNCFIQSVSDDLVNPGGIMDLWTREARLFKYGSGTGSNFSHLRGEDEPLSGGGKSSGLMSFLKIGDRAAGAIKSGGTTRRAAKMVCLDLDHPDIKMFVNWKVREELKVAALAEGIKHLSNEQQETAKRLGLKLDYDFNGEAYHTVSGQNSNNSVRISNKFFKALEEDGDWSLTRRTDGKVSETVKARDLWGQIAYAAWRCADPGVQYDTTINEWHTCPKSGRINASNPCVTGDTRVLTPGGIWRRIDQMIHLPARVVTNLDGQEIHVTEGAFPTGTRDVFELHTAGGYRVKLTADHKVWTRSRGWVPARSLTTADEVQLPGRPACVHEVGEPQDVRFFQLLGLFLSDANARTNELRLDACLKDADLMETFSRYVSDNWGTPAAHSELDSASSCRSYDDNYANREMVDPDVEHGRGKHGDPSEPLPDATSSTMTATLSNRRLINRLKAFVRREPGTRRLGDEAFTAGLAAQKHLLRALFTADGVVTDGTIELRSTNAALLEDVQLILLGFGIQSARVGACPEPVEGADANRPNQSIQWNNEGGAFVSGGSPGRRGTAVVPGLRTGGSDRPLGGPIADESRGDADLSRHGLRIDPGSLRSFGKYVGVLPGRKLERLADAISFARARSEGSANFDRVAAFLPMGRKQVFDLTEPVTGSFVANGLTVHNCSEYMFLDDTACNLASFNMLTFFDAESRRFDLEGYRHAIRLWTIVLEVSVLMASFPSEEIAVRSYKFRTLGLGYANLGAMLMQAGIPYDSQKGRAICATLTSILTGESYATSAEMAGELGAFPGYAENRSDMLRVIRNHRRAAYDVSHNAASRRGLGAYEKVEIEPVGIDADQFADSDPMAPVAMLQSARECWDRALALGERNGYRNAQVTVIAPTGTIGLLMDCDTTGVEPDFALVKFKKLAGGGYFKIANQSLRPALDNLGYQPDQIHDILKYVMGTLTLHDAPHLAYDRLLRLGFTPEELDKIEAALPATFEVSFAFSPWALGEAFFRRMEVPEADWKGPKFNLLRRLGFTRKQIDEANDVICGRGTIEGAPHLKDEHLAVFDCANRCGKVGRRFIPVEGHIRMMAAAQPFISGAISKTINLPNEATVEDIKQSYQLSWELGLKANALYRDGSKLSQPLNAKSDEDLDDVAEEDADAVAEAREEVAADVARAAHAVAVVAPAANVSSSDNLAPLSPAHTHTIEKIVERIVERPLRRRLPDTRRAVTHKFDVAGHEGYITVGLYDDGQPGEVFIRIAKEGSTIGGLMDTIATLVSVSLQYGVPVESLVRKFEHVRFEPSGMTRNADIPMAKSLVDYIFRWMAMEFVPGYRAANAPQRSAKKSGEVGSGEVGSGKSSPPAEESDDEATSAGMSSTLPARNPPKPAPAKKPGNGHGPRFEPDSAKSFSYDTPGSPSAPGDGPTHSPRNVGPEPGGVNLRLAIVADPLSQQGSEMQADAPACDVCGSITVRSGTCYKCLNCGNSMGCS